MILTSIISLAVILAAIVGMIGLRARPLRIRLPFEIGCLLATMWLLSSSSASPILSDTTIPAGVPGISTRIVAACWWLIAARIVASGLAAILGHDERSRETRLMSDLLGAAAYLLAALCVLNFVLDLPVKGVLATSGVVAIVIGLALQNTLADVFSGIAVGIEAPFSVGDRISLGEKVEGVVVQMNWRSTHVKTDGDDVAIIPNSRVARLDIINHSVPTERRSAQVEMLYPAAIEPESILEVLEDAILLSPGLVTMPQASASLVRLGAQRNTYAVDFSVAQTSRLGAAKGELLQAIWRQMRFAGPAALRYDSEGLPSDGGSKSDLLRQTGLFDALTDVHINNLSAKLVTHNLASGEVLFVQGEEDPTLYMVVRGVIEFAIASEGRSAIALGRIGAGAHIGEICLLTGAPHPVTAKALTRCEIESLSKDALAPLLQANPDMMTELERAATIALAHIRKGSAVDISRRAAGSTPLLGRIVQFFHHTRLDRQSGE